MLFKLIFDWLKLIIGSLYPTYLSYKALKQRDEKECVRMIMYWIVFSIYSFFEGFLDIFLGFWLPFYYESKIIFIFWLISPYGNGARILYENFVNKKLEQHEQLIDEYIDNIKQFSIDAMWTVWNKCSFHLNRLLLVSLTKGHMAAIHYIHDQYRSSSMILTGNNKDSDKNLCLSLLDNNDGMPLIDEPMDTENEDPTYHPDPYNNNEDDDDAAATGAEKPKKTLRKTKRKRKVVIEDISLNKPVTRSSRIKASATTSETENS